MIKLSNFIEMLFCALLMVFCININFSNERWFLFGFSIAVFVIDLAVAILNLILWIKEWRKQ